jgi:CopG family transcriptional regulator/antitoxin EndoAI
MKTTLKKSKQSEPKKEKLSPDTRPPRRGSARPQKERVLVEFPSSLLQQADVAASRMEKNRSEFIRTAVELLLAEIEKKRFEAELAAAYAANAPMNLELAEEFAPVDREGL